jgi:hypothetical protein
MEPALAAEEKGMTWPPSHHHLSEAERNLLATLSELPRLHPIVSMFAFAPPSALAASARTGSPSLALHLGDSRSS